MGSLKSRPLRKTGTPGVFRRGNRYVAVVRIDGRQHKIAVRTEAEGKRIKARETLDPRSLLRPIAADATTVEGYAREWLTTYSGRTARGIRDSTKAEYLRDLELHVFPHIGHLQLDEISARDISQLVKKLKRKKLSPGSVRNALAPLKAMLASATEDGDLASNPASGVRLPGGGKRRRPEVLTDAELKALIKAVPKRSRPFVTVVAFTGIRASEALGLRWSSVNLDKKRIVISERRRGDDVDETKSDAGTRTVPLAPEAVKALRRQAKLHPGGPKDFVFRSPRGAALSYSNFMRRDFKPAARKVGVGWAGLHALRHTCATRLFRAGVNEAQVARWLGHKDSGFTVRTYVHLDDTDLPDPSILSL